MSQLILNLDSQELKDKTVYLKKDVTKYMHVIKKDFDENLCDDKALAHIKESASYIHNLRRQSKI